MMTDWLTDFVGEMMTECLIGWHTGVADDWLIDWLVWLTNIVDESVINWFTDVVDQLSTSDWFYRNLTRQQIQV